MSKKDIDALRALMNNEERPVTVGVHKWVQNGMPVTAEAQRRVAEVMQSDNTIGRDGTGRFRPSLIGFGCNRAQMLSFIGEPVTKEITIESQTTMAAGTWSHYRWQTAGLSAGWLSDIEVKVEYLPWRLTGSIDGILSDGSGFELKTTSNRNYSGTNEPKHSHLLQIHAYMRALDIDCFSLVYENRDTLDFKEFRVKKDAAIDWELDMMFENLLANLSAQTLPGMLTSCIEKVSTNFQYKYCNYSRTCPKAIWSQSNEQD